MNQKYKDMSKMYLGSDTEPQGRTKWYSRRAGDQKKP